LPGRRPVMLEQVHGDRVVGGRQAAEAAPLRADAVVCIRDEAPGLVAAVRTADCVPVLLVSTRGGAVAAVHAGWRGAAASIATRALEWLDARGVRPESLVAAIGPAIGPCCYEVGPEVALAVAQATGVTETEPARPGGGRVNLDLPRAVALQLRRGGVPESAIHIAPWCTACRPELFFSYRADGGATGRMMACIGWS